MNNIFKSKNNKENRPYVTDSSEIIDGSSFSIVSIKELCPHEITAVAGAPEVINDPQPGP